MARRNLRAVGQAARRKPVGDDDRFSKVTLSRQHSDAKVELPREPHLMTITLREARALGARPGRVEALKFETAKQNTTDQRRITAAMDG
jgi:hypothetical protein